MTQKKRKNLGRGLAALFGEEGRTLLERVWSRPSLDVNGIWGGFTGTGSMTVLPARASAKISTRLVKNQDPAGIGEKLGKDKNDIPLDVLSRMVTIDGTKQILGISTIVQNLKHKGISKKDISFCIKEFEKRKILRRLEV